MSYIGFRPLWIEINLRNLAYNLLQIKKKVSSQTKIMAIVKKDAYGHGMLEVSKALSSLGVDYLGVASVEEAIKLRKAGIRLPILILGNVLRENLRNLTDYDLTFSISNFGLADALNSLSRKFKKKIKVHIKVDTGMSRLGVIYPHAFELIKRVVKLDGLYLEGIFTHLACADKDRDFTLLQIKRFKEILRNLRENSVNIPLVHCANSIGIVDFPESHFNMVRPGLILYGLYPKEGLNIKLKPLFSLKTKIVLVKRVPSGWGVSYAHKYKLKKSSYIGVLPVGYGDGYFRAFSNKVDVLIRGERFRSIGIICMDTMMVDLKDREFKEGENVVLIGRQGKELISIEELAKIIKTIPYEITCSLGSRIPRIYRC